MKMSDRPRLSSAYSLALASAAALPPFFTIFYYLLLISVSIHNIMKGIIIWKIPKDDLT